MGEEGDRSAGAPPGGVADLRSAVGSYVRAVHEAYLTAGGGEEGRGLADGPFTVVAAAASSLHVLATRDGVDAPDRGTTEPEGTQDLTWQLKFLDPSVAPQLNDVPCGPNEAAAVQEALGIERVLYHLVVGQGSALTGHHAMHTGTGIAHREQQHRGDGA